MNKETALAVFENYNIRRIYDEESETWFFSVVDIIAALTQQSDHQAARNYWKVLKNRLNKEGSETVTNCNRLKMLAEDGKLFHPLSIKHPSLTTKPYEIFGVLQVQPSRRQSESFALVIPFQKRT